MNPIPFIRRDSDPTYHSMEAASLARHGMKGAAALPVVDNILGEFVLDLPPQIDCNKKGDLTWYYPGDRPNSPISEEEVARTAQKQLPHKERLMIQLNWIGRHIKHIEQTELLSEIQSKSYELMISQLLSIYASVASQADQIEVPIRTADGHWELVPYNVKEIPIVEQGIAGSYTMHALLSCSQQERAMLLCRGTDPNPRSEVGLQTLYTDIAPGGSVGRRLLEAGHESIQAFIEEQAANGQIVEVHGTSLGGALAMQIATEFRDIGAKAVVTVPASLDEEIKGASNIDIIGYGQDVVINVGKKGLPEGAHYWYMLPPEQKGILGSHTTFLSPRPGTKLMQVTKAFYDNELSHRGWTVATLKLGRATCQASIAAGHYSYDGAVYTKELSIAACAKVKGGLAFAYTGLTMRAGKAIGCIVLGDVTDKSIAGTFKVPG